MKKNEPASNYDALKDFVYISRYLEKSGTVVLSWISDRMELMDLNDLEEEKLKSLRAAKKTIISKLNAFAEYLSVTPVQAAFFVAVYSEQIRHDNSIDTGEIIDFFSASAVSLLPVKSDFGMLVDNHFLEMANSFTGMEYKVPKRISDALEKNLPVPPYEEQPFDRYGFCSKVSRWVTLRSAENFDSDELMDKVSALEQENKNREFVSDIIKLGFDIETRTLFYVICNDFVSGTDRTTEIDETLTDIFDNPRYRMTVAHQIMDETHPLMKSELVEKQAANFFTEAELSLTEKGKRIFLAEDYELFAMNKEKNSRLLTPVSKIAEKQMFYDPELTAELDFIRNSLMEDNLKKLRKRLENKKLIRGISAIFYGLPGTGKTETALQIAKATGRAVYHVDISAAKSCWFGESEKQIKKIFTDYQQMCETEKISPILLFNEVDALFSKRKEVGYSSVDQTENTMQNILLEELERLDGILIATTNLVENLDSAFERRFTFKVKFGKPSLEAKKLIWQSKIETLSDDEARKLAQSFDLSGGEIDNIVRKVIMDEVLHETQTSFSVIESYCRNEKLLSKDGKIGFVS